LQSTVDVVLEGSEPSFHVLLVTLTAKNKETIIAIDAIENGIREAMGGRFKEKRGDNVCKPGGLVTTDGEATFPRGLITTNLIILSLKLN
jgi:hypothetical protein